MKLDLALPLDQLDRPVTLVTLPNNADPALIVIASEQTGLQGTVTFKDGRLYEVVYRDQHNVWHTVACTNTVPR